MLTHQKICLPKTRRINLKSLLIEESEKEEKRCNHQTKHPYSEFSHKPEVELIKLKDITFLQRIYWQLNNVLKGVNHGNRLDHSKYGILVEPWRVLRVSVQEHYQAVNPVRDHQHDPNRLLLVLNCLVNIRVAGDFNLCRSYKDHVDEEKYQLKVLRTHDRVETGQKAERKNHQEFS